MIEEEEEGGSEEDDDEDEEMGLPSATATATSASVTSAAATSAAAAAAPQSLTDVLGPGWVAPGQYVCLRLRAVPAWVLSHCLVAGVPLLPSALLRHENKTSVVNFNVIRYAPYSEPVSVRGGSLDVGCVGQ